MTAEIGQHWVPKRGKAGKAYSMRHPMRPPQPMTCTPLTVKQVYRPDKAVLVIDAQNVRRIVRVVDLKKHWKLEQ